MTALDIPETVRKRALVLGAEDWLAGLPDLIAEIEREWSIEVGSPFSGGSEAYVAEATLVDGSRGVLKLLMPRSVDVERHEITAL
jgi:streptomycin 6-kinase